MANIAMAIVFLVGFYFTAKEIVGDWFSLFNLPALLLVLVGLLFLSTFLVGKDFFKVISSSLVSSKNKNKEMFKPELLKDIVQLSHERYSESGFRDSTLMNIQDDFLNLCLSQKLESTLGPESLGRVYQSLAQKKLQAGLDTASKMKTLAQYSPGIGAFGALLALIGYTSHLDSTIVTKGIGELLVICLYSVLYGYFFANFILSPLADSISYRAEKEFRKNEIISHGLYLIFSSVNPKSIEAELASYIEVPNNQLSSLAPNSGEQNVTG